MVESPPKNIQALPKVENPLPAGWERQRLDAITVRGSGHTPDQSKPNYWNGGIEWVSLADSSRLDRGYICETEKNISELGVSKSSAVIHKADTVILSRDAGVGKSAVLKHDMAVSQHFIAWECREKDVLDPWFLYSWLQVQKQFFERMAIGSTIKTIGLPLFRRITVDFPPLPEQRKIAEILRTWDEAIGKLEKLQEAKQQRFNWLKSLSFEGHSDGVTSSFGAFLSESREPVNSDDPTQRLTVRLHLRGVAARPHRGTEAKGATQFFRRQAGQFIYGKQNIFRGSLGLIPQELDGYTSTQDLPAFDIDTSLVVPEWLLWLLWYVSRPSFYTALEHFASGSGSKRLHPKELLRQSITVPPLTHQKQVVQRLNDAQREIRLTENALTLYTCQKRGLMQKLLTGEWRVKAESGDS